MNRLLSVLGCALLLSCLSGCGNTPDGLMKSQIKDLNRLADAIEDGASDEEFKKITDRINARTKTMNELELTEEQKEELIERHKKDLEAAGQRLQEATMEAIKNRRFPGHPPEIGPLFS